MTALMVLLMLIPCVILIGLIVLYIHMEKANFDRLQHSFAEAIVSSDEMSSEAQAPVSERIGTLPPEYDDEDPIEDESEGEDLGDDPGEEESEELPWD